MVAAPGCGDYLPVGRCRGKALGLQVQLIELPAQHQHRASNSLQLAGAAMLHHLRPGRTYRAK